MERFLSSYKPPPPKKSKLSEEDQLENNRKYETEKRKRAFNPSWKNTFGWLEYHVVNGEGKMFCSICRRYDHVKLCHSSSIGNGGSDAVLQTAPEKAATPYTTILIFSSSAAQEIMK